MRYVKLLILVWVVGSCDSGTGIGTGGTFIVAVGTEQFRVRIENSLLATHIPYWVDTVKQYCPWGGRFVSEVGRF